MISGFGALPFATARAAVDPVSRMPAILTREDRDAWLKGTPEEGFDALKQYPDAHLITTPVSTRVNAPKNNDVTLIAPLAA